MQRGGQSLSRVGTVAIFALIETQEHANTVSLAPSIRAAERKLVDQFYRNVRAGVAEGVREGYFETG
jgi:hypothetical protein